MRTQTNSIVRRGVLIAAGALLTATLLLTTSTAQGAESQVNDRAGLLSQAAVMSSGPGSPIKSDQDVWVCEDGKNTKRMKEKDFIKKYQKDPSKWSNGPCATWTLVCENGHDTKFIKTSDLSKWLAGNPNRTVGNCTGVKPDDQRMICWNGWTIEVKVKDFAKYPSYTLGACP